jgi:hypothetical protein
MLPCVEAGLEETMEVAVVNVVITVAIVVALL